MKYSLIAIILSATTLFSQRPVIRINHLGWLPEGEKSAVLLSEEKISLHNFLVFDALTNEAVFSSEDIGIFESYGKFRSAYRLNFSEFKSPGGYYISAGGVKSPLFYIGEDAYRGAADYILRYMRQQRCGYNPFLKDSCHTHDGYIADHPALDSVHIDVTGGWHDASDYLQYTTTSANATFQMLFAYEQNPGSFGDYYDKNGDPGSNGIPDILDEARWGLDWLAKMNPDSGYMFNQIADDRDHRGYRLPTKDSVSYGKGLERPVYFVTGKPQGLAKYKNRTTGVSSTAAKFASAFAKGAEILKDIDPEFSEKIKLKAVEAWEFALSDPGVCQTACNVSPYFYEEDNYADDMELAAFSLYKLTGDENYLINSAYWGDTEPVTPWMGADSARHYQWYPFLNLGHYYIGNTADQKYSGKFIYYLKKGLTALRERAADNPFLNGIPYIWCSNNLTVAAATQASLYRKITGDDTFMDMEYALIDWLFGVNPWGTSMICGLPAGRDYPADPHSALTTLYGWLTEGGLVDGPVYSTIYNRLLGIKLYHGDEYEQYQPGMVVYHDDHGDYSTNEPTMDGTASLSYILSELEKNSPQNHLQKDGFGAVRKMNPAKKNIYLVFTGHEFAEGGIRIAEILDKNNIKASFFLTGDFYRNPDFSDLIKKLKKAGHYLGAHSDKHLLYAPWDNRDSTLISEEEFIQDIRANYREMDKFGINKSEASWFLPPYEWYNKDIAHWTKLLGLKLVNYSPGTLSHTDYTLPDSKNYRSSDEIFNSIIKYEKENGMNGFILLTHIGAGEKRTDKFYERLEEVYDYFIMKGYTFLRFY